VARLVFALAIAGTVSAGAACIEGYDPPPPGSTPADAAAETSPVVPVAAAAAYASVILEDHPIVYFRFAEDGGLAARSERGGPEAIYDGVTHGVASPLAESGDRAIGLGGSAYVILPRRTDDGLDFDGQAEFSLEIWASAEGADDTYRYLFDRRLLDAGGGGGDAKDAYGISLHEESGLSFGRHSAAGSTSVSLSLPKFSFDVYHHVVGTYDGAEVRLYVDGTLADVAGDLRPQAMKDGPLYIGTLNRGYGHWRGRIDEAAIYATALDADRVKRHYDAAASGR
jgi:hypothetical protein